MKKIILGIMILFSFSFGNKRYFYDGNRLYKEGLYYKKLRIIGNNSNRVDVAYGFSYTGYILGVVDGYDGKNFCIPDEVTVGEICDVVFNMLDKVPAVRNFPANIIVQGVLKGKWPCKK